MKQNIFLNHHPPHHMHRLVTKFEVAEWEREYWLAEVDPNTFLHKEQKQLNNVQKNAEEFQNYRHIISWGHNF